MSRNAKPFRGDPVRIRSVQEIAATLDKNGALDSLPFMPEMEPFCGKEFIVACRLEKTCVEGSGVRSLQRTVILEGLECDGAAHDGCQKRCPLLWKEAWLDPHPLTASGPRSISAALPSPDLVLPTKKDDGRYFCQSTELANATAFLPRLCLKKYASELTAGNVTLWQGFRLMWLSAVRKLKARLFGLSSVQPVGDCASTPTEALNLQPGETVEVKRPEEIALTLDRKGHNRGLAFTPHMLPFCGQRYMVKNRAERMILETTGQMRQFKNTIILEGVTCDGTAVFGGCSRNVHHLWREIWLKRVDTTRDTVRRASSVSGDRGKGGGQGAPDYKPLRDNH